MRAVGLYLGWLVCSWGVGLAAGWLAYEVSQVYPHAVPALVGIGAAVGGGYLYRVRVLHL